MCCIFKVNEKNRIQFDINKFLQITDYCTCNIDEPFGRKNMRIAINSLKGKVYSNLEFYSNEYQVILFRRMGCLPIHGLTPNLVNQLRSKVHFRILLSWLMPDDLFSSRVRCQPLNRLNIPLFPHVVELNK